MNLCVPSNKESQQLLSEAQLAQIQSIASHCVEQAAAEIASNATWAAVQAMSNSTSCVGGSNTANNIPVVLDESEVCLVNEGNIPTLTANQSTNTTQLISPRKWFPQGSSGICQANPVR